MSVNTMNITICDADDEGAITRFKRALTTLEAQFVDKEQSSVGVDVYDFRIGNSPLRIFSDQWLIDIEGEAQVVEMVVREFNLTAPR